MPCQNQLGHFQIEARHIIRLKNSIPIHRSRPPQFFTKSRARLKENHARYRHLQPAPYTVPGLFIRHDTDRENPRAGTTNLFTSGLSPNDRYMSCNAIPPNPSSPVQDQYVPIVAPVKRAGKLVASSGRSTINLDFKALICSAPYTAQANVPGRV